MSESEQDQGQVAELDTNGTSLEARMRVRREEVEQLVSEKFPLPHFESVAAVELRYVGWEQQRAIYDRYKRMPTALRELYTACDSILTATVGFFELNGAGDEQGTPVEHSWNTLAAGVCPDLRDDATPRQALIALITPEQVPTLYNEWQEWMKGEQAGVDGEVSRDFRATR
jgi:hypothetical protein